MHDAKEPASGPSLTVHLLNVLPVDEIFPERLQIIRPAVAIVDVIGVLPHVAAEDRGGTLHQWALAVWRLVDHELAVLYGNPAPARAELGHPRLDKVFLRLRYAA